MWHMIIEAMFYPQICIFIIKCNLEFFYSRTNLYDF